MTESHQEAGNSAESIDRKRVDEMLVAATQDGQLRRVVTELIDESPQLTSDGRARIDEAATALDELDAAVTTECDRLVDMVQANGVTVQVNSGAANNRPLHLIGMNIERDAVDAAVGAIETAGYRRLAPTRASQWRAFRSTRGSCLFVRNDHLPFRVQLGWPNHPLATGVLGKLVVPHASDLEAYDLPANLWAGYSLIHLARLPARLVRRSGEPADLGPFLSTPDDLIEPLLRFAGVRSSDLLVDLGSGDGRIPIVAAERFGCRARGVEYDAALVGLANSAMADSFAAERLESVLGDAVTAPLDDADVVVAFLPVDTLRLIIPDILSRLRPGTRLIVHEQERLNVSPAPDLQSALISAGGVTVAHRWNR